MFNPTLAPSRATRRRLSRARAVRRAADFRCGMGPARRPCRSASSGVVLVDGVPVAACPAHLPDRLALTVRARAARDGDQWARDLLAKLRREAATRDDDGA
ncbi:hypothetical protein [Micromonospora chalcea]|uniref:hypothetical protein n=1 Tax=Micromonospora chalcea TaxID=1874 RepID=UPI003CECF657